MTVSADTFHHGISVSHRKSNISTMKKTYLLFTTLSVLWPVSLSQVNTISVHLVDK